MTVQQINNRLTKLYGNSIRATAQDDHLLLEGQLSTQQDVVNAGRLAVKLSKRRYGRVVSDITVKGHQYAPMRIPSIVDNSLDGTKVDVLVIGGGIVGASVLRELSKYNITSLLVDKEEDLALHASGRNDGEVHVGIDLTNKTNKLAYCVRGNAMFEPLCKQLDVDFERVGQYVVSTSHAMRIIIPFIKSRMRKGNIAGGVEILSRKQLLARQPNIADGVKWGMFFPIAGSVCPYNMTIALAECGVQNGAKVSLSTAVISMQKEGNKIISVTTNRGKIYPKVVINCGGAFADKIAQMADDRFYSIHPRKGTNSILDKSSVVKLTDSILAGYGTSKRDKKKHTKGGGFILTVDHNILLGPNAAEVCDREDNTTDVSSINEVFGKQSIVIPNVSKGDIITYFSGTRAANYEEDFVIEQGHKAVNMMHAGGIQSPGLTAAPAIAVDIVKLTLDYFANCGQTVSQNDNFIANRKRSGGLAKLPIEQRDSLIKSNPDYGIIVCRCEEVSKGEIIDALNSIIPPTTVDGIKRRVRPGMGRCQGGFCQPLVMSIMAQHNKVDITTINKRGDSGNILFGDTKEGN